MRNLPSRRMALALLGAGALGACSQASDPFFRTAGAQFDDGAFGSATRNNVGVHSGELAALSHLGGRFEDAVPTTITFPFDSASLTAEARGVLDRQAEFMSQFPEVRFSVFGHTDLVGSASYNRALGERRARAAVRYLASRGISTQRLDALVSLGESQPVVPTEGREQANRRTVTRVAGFVQDHPLVLDGKYAQVVYRQYVGSAASAATGESIADSTATGTFAAGAGGGN